MALDGDPATKPRTARASAGCSSRPAAGLRESRCCAPRVEAAALLRHEGLRIRVIAGPFLPPEAWRSLRRARPRAVRVELRRSVPDLRAELDAAAASVSQCGYNTALDLLVSGVPALVVPFAEPGEDEQTRRALRLARLGAVRCSSRAA